MRFFRSQDPRLIWRRYLLAISIIVIFVSFDHLTSVFKYSGNQGLASAINVSGRQRLLSQRILYFAAAHLKNPDDDSHRERLAGVINLFEASHSRLAYETQKSFKFDLNPSLSALYQTGVGNFSVGLNQLATRFIADSRAVLDNANEARDEWARMNDVGPNDLLTMLDRAVQGFEAMAIARSERNFEISMVSYGLALLVLLLEALFIFRPAHRMIIKNLNALQSSQAETEASLKVAQEARKEADEANATKSAFLASMSHEIRTPMNGILGMVSNLLGGKLNPVQREQVQVIKESGDTLLELLNDILDLSKVEAGHMELEYNDFSISKLLDSTSALWESRVQAKALEYAVYNELGDLDIIFADGQRVRQVLFNLISNAVKFSEKGSIEIIVGRQARDDNKLGIRFEIRDTGIGLDDQAIENLFKPFSQADKSTTRKFGGTGLGLAICKKIVELHGGEIGVQSQPGEGSTFWFHFAAEEGNVENLVEIIDAGDDELAEKLTQIEKPLRILVAEDNHINQKVIEALLLGSIKCSIDFVGNGLEAVQQVQAQKYDVVLMDVQMPEMDGPTATRKIRALSDKETANIPIIALTANAMKGDRETYLAAGMSDYVTKPIDPRILFGAILRSTDNPSLSTHPSVPSVLQQEPRIQGAYVTAELQNLVSEFDKLIETDNQKSDS